jgi:hypothetical protein
MNDKEFKSFGKKDGNKFLGFIRANPLLYARWEYKDGCFLIWCKGLLSKLEGETTYCYIDGRGWVGY